MMLWYGGHWAFWQAGLMWIGMIVFWGLLIWGVYALVISNRRPGGSDRDSDPRRILDERLARGEISAEEYQRLVELLGSGRPRTPANSAKGP